MRRFGRQVKQRPILVPVQEAIHIGLEQLLRQLLARYPVQYHRPRQNLAPRFPFALRPTRYQDVLWQLSPDFHCPIIFVLF